MFFPSSIMTKNAVCLAVLPGVAFGLNSGGGGVCPVLAFLGTSGVQALTRRELLQSREAEDVAGRDESSGAMQASTSEEQEEAATTGSSLPAVPDGFMRVYGWQSNINTFKKEGRTWSSPTNSCTSQTGAITNSYPIYYDWGYYYDAGANMCREIRTSETTKNGYYQREIDTFSQRTVFEQIANEFKSSKWSTNANPQSSATYLPCGAGADDLWCASWTPPGQTNCGSTTTRGGKVTRGKGCDATRRRRGNPSGDWY